MSAPQVVVLPDMEALTRRAAQDIAAAIAGGPAGEPFSVALTGGNTPRGPYRALATLDVPWDRVRFVFGDERCVPPDADGSNYRMAHDALLGRVPLEAHQVTRIHGELRPDEAARQAEEDLRAAVPGTPWPIIDLLLLGMGPDGHVASLFPGAAEVDERRRLAVPVHRPDLPQPWRVSLTMPVLNAARRTLLMVSGADKAAAAARAIAGDPDLPAGRLRRDPSTTWLLTADAAAGVGVRGR